MINVQDRQWDQIALERQLLEIKSGKRTSWAQIGHTLDVIDKTGYWQNEANSFTEWLRHNAFNRFGVKRSTLWRYLSAGRYYNQLHEILRPYGYTLCPLIDLPDYISPENLELLSKLARVVSAKVFDDLAEQVLSGDIRRSELRSIWEAYRPVLNGQTTRGGVEVATLNIQSETQRISFQKATVLTTLTKAMPDWTGVLNPDIFELFLNVKPLMDPPVDDFAKFDAVAVIVSKESQRLDIHGITIATDSFGVNMLAQLEKSAKFCSALWLATPEFSPTISEIITPPFVGVLRIQDGNITVERKPSNSPFLGTHLLAMTNGLLLKLLNR